MSVRGVGISVIILARNEERDLPRLLESLKWCEDVHVVDDRSDDATLDVAVMYGVKCHSHDFESFGSQRNWALANCSTSEPWVLFLDADEECTPEFVEALTVAIDGADGEVAGFFCCWKLMLEGRWLRRCDAFPKWQLRVVRKGRAWFTDFGHGQKEGEVHGRLDYIREPYLHHAFSKGWTHWIDRHNGYSSKEALSRLDSQISLREIFASSPSVRNKALKPLVSRLPVWPLLRFVVDYVVRLGFLEGRSGLIYCVNIAIYEYFIRIKMREMQGGSVRVQKK